MLIETMQQLIEDVSDPGSQKVAVIFLSRCVTAWGRETNQALPGFDRFIYERLVPTAFRVPSLPGFNAKDGQMMVVSLFHTFVFYCTLNYLYSLTKVLHEIANLLQTVCKVRGTEAYNFFLNIFLPSQSWPPDTALDFTTKLRDLDGKSFRKYFTDLIRSSRASTS